MGREARIGHLRLDQIAPRHIKPYLNDALVTDSTKRMRFRQLRAFFEWLSQESLLHPSPLRKLKPPREVEKVPQFLTRSDLQRLFDCMDEYQPSAVRGKTPQIQWLKDVIIVAVTTGLRRGELCSLTWRAVDFENEQVAILVHRGFRSKSGDERAVPLAEDALRVLHRLHDERSDDYVFHSPTGKPLGADYLTRRFKFFCQLAGLPEHIHFHSLRHTTVSWLVQNGVSLAIAKEIAGHRRIETSERYAHLAPGHLRKPIKDTFRLELD